MVVSQQRSLVWAVRLFLFLAAVLCSGGVAIPIVFRVWSGRFLLFTPRVDEILFGRTPADIVAGEPAVLEVQLFYVDLAATLLLALGVLLGFLTWFGLRPGHRWAWWAGFISVIVAAASLARVALPYILQAPFGVADVPPIFWVLVLAPIPLVLGWRGTKAQRVTMSAEGRRA
jgi:hypothetical protein